MRSLLSTVAALFVMTSVAEASVIANLGVDPTSSGGAFNHSLGSLIGNFDDQYTFTLDHNATLTIASVTNVFPSKTDFIKNFTGGVFAGTPALPGAEVIGPIAATLGCGPITKCQGFAGSAVLAKGSYFLDISGFAKGTSGYGGNLSTIAPTPVPAALPLFAGGLSLLGLMGWKRRRRDSQDLQS